MINTNLLQIIIICLLLFGCKQTNTIMQEAPINSIDIDTFAKELLNDSLINALSIGIYHKGESLTKHYGELDKLKNNKPTDETIYEIASVTKTLVGNLIAQAENENKLSLEDDIRKYLNDSYENLEYQGEPIRIKHLLTHTSELPRFLPESINELFEDVSEDLPFQIAAIENSYSKINFLQDLKNVSISTMPGTRFSYSNADTELAAHILETIYGKSFDKILEEKICSRNDMSDTKINLSESQRIRLANGYGKNGKRTPQMTTKLWGASGGGKSTIKDMINYIKLQLDQNNVIIQKTQQSLYDKEAIYGDPKNRIGYYWVLNQDQEFGKSISHHGGAFGTQNWLVIYPEQDLGISIFTNQGDWQTSGKLMGIIDKLKFEIAKAHNNKSYIKPQL